METTKKTFKEWFRDLNKKKILMIALNVLIWLFVIFSLMITILVFSAQGSKDGVPAIFGKSLITISSESMEPTYEKGDLVFMTKLSQEEIADLKPGAIITYRAPMDIDGDGIKGDINTHRIEKVEGNSFITKGDHNETRDGYTVHVSDVIGVCTEDGKIGGLGNVIKFLRSSLGFFLCIVLPLILFFLYELYNFVSIIVSERAKRAAEAAPAPVDEEEIKRRAVEEYLAKQNNEEEIKRRAIEEYLAAQAKADDAENAAAENATTAPEEGSDDASDAN